MIILLLSTYNFDCLLFAIINMLLMMMMTTTTVTGGGSGGVCDICLFVFCLFVCLFLFAPPSSPFSTPHHLVSCYRPFLLVLLLKERRFPVLRVQVSDCNIFCIMCNVHSISIFCNESTDCVPGLASKRLFTPLLLFWWPH